MTTNQPDFTYGIFRGETASFIHISPEKNRFQLTVKRHIRTGNGAACGYEIVAGERQAFDWAFEQGIGQLTVPPAKPALPQDKIIPVKWPNISAGGSIYMSVFFQETIENNQAAHWY